MQEFTAALKGEQALQEFCDNMRPDLLKADAEGVTKSLASLLPEVDKAAVLEHKEIGQYLVESLHESLKNNCDGWVDDDLAFTVPWGFELSEIKVPVMLWQGSLDKMVPFAHGEWLAEHLPKEHLRKHLVQGQGHISISDGNEESMIDELLDVLKA